MSVRLERQTIYLGGALTRTAWIVYDGTEMMDWYLDYDAAHLRAHDLIEQRTHRDGI